ncbi:sensor histidine kinase [Flagellimonas meridianipacifica]|uniref:histidine kinase n=1 Tax=Flagellimonas meridianipacifica TaxID=1080225 RepID=A0A2T0MGY2_9FLAO|nr:ATP-binding protein [Allomuricauda pacifica]PRX56825.1 nitrogen-specific signal transduction histidine kinase [Allomuricauda pacifica]
MVSNNFYYRLIVRVVFIGITALGIAYTFINKEFLFSGLWFLFFVVQIILLVRFFNQMNSAIAYLFKAMKNEDFTLRFPKETKLKSLNELNHSLNLLNDTVQDLYLKNEAKEKYYQEIIKQADIGILTVNPAGHILFANPTMERLLNHSPLNHIKQLQQVDEKLYQLFSELKPFDRKLVELTNEREQKQLALKSRGIVLNEQELLLVVAQDIDKELDEKQTESWVRLIRVLTHEIMNTITPITSISDTIIKYFSKNGEAISASDLEEAQIQNTVKGLQVIKDQGGDLMDFVQSYRTLLSVPEPDRTLVNGFNLINKIQVLLETQAKESGVEFTIDCTPLNLEIYIDEKQISQVLLNLCKNAIQSSENTNNAQVQLIAKQESGIKTIEVRDNGPGIPKELMEEIFVPFFTTKTSGTGIGLSLSKRVMQLHGGSIKVHSIPSVETVFRLTFI